MSGLTNREISVIVYRYIGVSGGYLGDFSYNTHARFYPEYCDLDIQPDQYPGTTRERFMTILQNSAPQIQAKILRGVLDRFPLDINDKPTTRTKKLYDELCNVIARLEGQLPIETPDLGIASVIVERAISDMETLIQANGSISGIDRVHTVLHGYLRAVCDKEQIAYAKDDSMVKLLKLLRQHHSAFANLGARSQDVERILLSFASILDALNPIRNNASVAHPNEELLGKDEATLVINVARTLLHYLNAKFD